MLKFMTGSVNKQNKVKIFCYVEAFTTKLRRKMGKGILSLKSFGF